MELYNDTLLRGYLAHLQAKVRHLARLHFERNNHPGATELLKPNPELQETWEILARDLMKVLGVAIHPFHRLAGEGSFHSEGVIAGRDPFRITFKALKKKADKARRGDPSITLLKSWCLLKHTRLTEEEKDDIANSLGRGSATPHETALAEAQGIKPLDIYGPARR